MASSVEGTCIESLWRALNHPPFTMIGTARFNSWAAVLLLLFVALCAPVGAMATETKPMVLLLYSFTREIAPYNTIVAAFRSELTQASSEPLSIYDASLEGEQTTGLNDQFLELLRRRFAASPPDVVVTIGPPAAAFYLRNRDKMLPGTPAVIAALDVKLVPKSALRAGDRVVAVHSPSSMLVDNILRLLPETQRIAVVLGDSPLERLWLPKIQTEFAQFANQLNFEWLNKLSFEQMRKRIGNLPPHSAVLYGQLINDAIGVPYEQEDGLASLIEVSTAPIFSFYESEFGYGVVGGPYISERRVGALMAAAVLRTLNGQNTAAPAIELIEYGTPVYDWRALKRWGIDSARLPPGSEIRFRPPSLWDEHRALMTTAIGIFLLQAALLVGLLWQRIRRRRAEREALTLSGRLITAHEDERRWLARELHDDITQRLAGLAIAASKVPGSDSSPTDLEASRTIRGGLAQLSEDVHNLSYRLHPSVIDDLGLVEALKAECERVARTESLRIEVHADRLPPSLPKEVSLSVYRVAQEALRNIGRHAKASIVQLSLALKDGGLLLSISDNGRGFEPGLQPSRPSLGHASMRERIRSLGGELDIQSTSGGGTTVRAWVPIVKEAS